MWSREGTTRTDVLLSESDARTRDSFEDALSPARLSGWSLMGLQGTSGLVGQRASTRFASTGTRRGGRFALLSGSVRSRSSEDVLH